MKNMNKMDTSLYRDPNTGRWLQRGGSFFGSPDEIDTSVAGESSIDRAIRRNALTETLVPMDLLIQLPDPELRALELLLDVLTSSDLCRASSEGGGRIICRLDQDVDVEILVEYMIRVRLGLPWHDTEEENFPPRHDTHVICYMHLTDGKALRYASEAHTAWIWHGKETYSGIPYRGSGPQIQTPSYPLSTQSFHGPSGHNAGSRTPRNPSPIHISN